MTPKSLRSSLKKSENLVKLHVSCFINRISFISCTFIIQSFLLLLWEYQSGIFSFLERNIGATKTQISGPQIFESVPGLLAINHQRTFSFRYIFNSKLFESFTSDLFFYFYVVYAYVLSPLTFLRIIVKTLRNSLSPSWKESGKDSGGHWLPWQRLGR